MLSSLPSTNTSKIHLHVKQLSQRQTRLAERLSYNQDYEERFTKSWVEREEKEAIRLVSVPVGGNTQEKVAYMGLEILPGE